MSAPWVTIFARLQAAFQAFFRPAVWLPYIRDFHRHREKWVMSSSSASANKQDIIRGIMMVIQNDKSRTYWKLNKAESDFVQVFAFSRFEWLNVIEFKIRGSCVEVHAFSSGVLPLFIPFACVLNLFLFLVPFCDFGLNKRRVSIVVDAIDMKIQRMSYSD